MLWNMYLAQLNIMTWIIGTYGLLNKKWAQSSVAKLIGYARILVSSAVHFTLKKMGTKNDLITHSLCWLQINAE